MGLLMMILAAFGGLFGAVAVGLLKDEAAAWLPSLNRMILAASVRRVPQDQQERYAEEWAAHVAEYPGKLSQLAQALRFLWAGLQLEGHSSFEVDGGEAGLMPASSFGVDQPQPGSGGRAHSSGSLTI